jgi:arginase family enzyme
LGIHYGADDRRFRRVVHNRGKAKNDLAELNRLLDIEGRTASFVIELISSMFGKRVV